MAPSVCLTSSTHTLSPPSTGTIPESIGRLEKLAHLYLFNNKLSGERAGRQQRSAPSICLSGQQQSLTPLAAILCARCAGELPADMGSAECLPALKWLDVENNPDLGGEWMEQRAASEVDGDESSMAKLCKGRW